MQATHMPSSIFVDGLGNPMTFSLVSVENKNRALSHIFIHGGVIMPFDKRLPKLITLADPDFKTFSKSPVYSVQYLYDCAEEQKKLPLKDYRLNPDSNENSDNEDSPEPSSVSASQNRFVASKLLSQINTGILKIPGNHNVQTSASVRDAKTDSKRNKRRKTELNIKPNSFTQLSSQILQRQNLITTPNRSNFALVKPFSESKTANITHHTTPKIASSSKNKKLKQGFRSPLDGTVQQKSPLMNTSLIHENALYVINSSNSMGVSATENNEKLDMEDFLLDQLLSSQSIPLLTSQNEFLRNMQKTVSRQDDYSDSDYLEYDNTRSIPSRKVTSLKPVVARSKESSATGKAQYAPQPSKLYLSSSPDASTESLDSSFYKSPNEQLKNPVNYQSSIESSIFSKPSRAKAAIKPKKAPKPNSKQKSHSYNKPKTYKDKQGSLTPAKSENHVNALAPETSKTLQTDSKKADYIADTQSRSISDAVKIKEFANSPVNSKEFPKASIEISSADVHPFVVLNNLLGSSVEYLLDEVASKKLPDNSQSNINRKNVSSLDESATENYDIPLKPGKFTHLEITKSLPKPVKPTRLEITKPHFKSPPAKKPPPFIVQEIGDMFDFPVLRLAINETRKNNKEKLSALLSCIKSPSNILVQQDKKASLLDESNISKKETSNKSAGNNVIDELIASIKKKNIQSTDTDAVTINSLNETTEEPLTTLNTPERKTNGETRELIKNILAMPKTSGFGENPKRPSLQQNFVEESYQNPELCFNLIPREFISRDNSHSIEPEPDESGKGDIKSLLNSQTNVVPPQKLYSVIYDDPIDSKTHNSSFSNANRFSFGLQDISIGDDIKEKDVGSLLEMVTKLKKKFYKHLVELARISDSTVKESAEYLHQCSGDWYLAYCFLLGRNRAESGGGSAAQQCKLRDNDSGKNLNLNPDLNLNLESEDAQVEAFNHYRSILLQKYLWSDAQDQILRTYDNIYSIQGLCSEKGLREVSSRENYLYTYSQV